MIRGDRVSLRPVDRSDLMPIVTWRNQPHVMAGLFSYRPLSLSQQERWFASYLGKQDEILFVIETEDSVSIGTIGLSKIEVRMRTP